MTLVGTILLLGVALLVLVRSGSAVVFRLSRIVAFLRITEFIAAFFLIGLATSLPELLIGVSGAIADASELAFAAIGSNLFHATMVLGISSLLMRRVPIGDLALRKENFLAIGFYFLPILLIADGLLSRIDGLVILTLFGFYTWYLLDRSETFKKIYTNMVRPSLGAFPQFLRDLAILILALIILILSAQLVVKSVQDLVSILLISPFLIAIFILGFGTALPELTFDIQAAIKKQHQGMILGNLFGSWAINAGLVLGLVSLIRPVVMPAPLLFWITVLFSILALIFLLVAVRSEQALTWKEGLGLIFIYILFVFIMSLIQSGKIF